jgi:hypothetical protein
LKIEIVAQTAEQATKFMIQECDCRGPITAYKSSEIRRHHDNVWNVDIRPDLGEVWPVFTVHMNDDCQAHIERFEGQPRVDDGDMWVIPRGFCALLPPANLPKCEYIIA